MLYTASFYAPGDWQGVRYRISRAHPRGKKTDWETLPWLYPSRPLLQERRGGGLDMDGLRQRYYDELEATLESAPEFRQWLNTLAAAGDFTLLCFERNAADCHRSCAAEWLQQQAPGLWAGGLR